MFGKRKELFHVKYQSFVNDSFIEGKVTLEELPAFIAAAQKILRQSERG